MAVWGHYYGHNLGDELVTATVISAVRKRRPEADVIAISLDPDDTRERHGVAAYPLAPRHASRTRARRGVGRILAGLRRRGASMAREVPHLWRSYRLLRGVDLIVVAGSGQLLDKWNGPWGHPWALFQWSWLARLTGTRMAILSVGAGPLNGGLARRLVRSAVEAADYVTVRDEHSRRVLQDAGVRRDLQVCPDMGFAHELPAPEEHRNERPVVGVNAMAHAHPGYWGRGELDRYQAYLDKMVALVKDLFDRGDTVHLFSSHASADQFVADDIVAAVWASEPRLAGRLKRDHFTDVGGLTRFIASCDAVVGTRYHSVLLPMLMQVPTVGIAYHPKTVEVMRMAGQSELCLPDIDGFQADELLGLAQRAITQRSEISASLAPQMAALRERVERQFDVILAPGATTGASAGGPAARQTERGRHVA
ncbi:MAG: polysaccharide pyruvyl transferase family protein [Dehalococcoidia bacterium]